MRRALAILLASLLLSGPTGAQVLSGGGAIPVSVQPTLIVANASGGTICNGLAKLTSTGVLALSSSDAVAPSAPVYLVLNESLGCGAAGSVVTGGFATLVQSGVVSCITVGSLTPGHFVVADPSTGWKCADGGAAPAAATIGFTSVGGAVILNSTLAGAGGASLSTSSFLGAAIAVGSPPTATGTCSINTQVGGNTAGSFKAASACTATKTVILTFAVAAPNGWSCFASDITTTADAMVQTAYSTTSCTLTVTMLSGDQAVFVAEGF